MAKGRLNKEGARAAAAVHGVNEDITQPAEGGEVTSSRVVYRSARDGRGAGM
jgi:hypothetical protein